MLKIFQIESTEYRMLRLSTCNVINLITGENELTDNDDFTSLPIKKKIYIICFSFQLKIHYTIRFFILRLNILFKIIRFHGNHFIFNHN